MFPRALIQYFNLKRLLFCQNQRIFVYGLPIDFFYFADFRWSFFGKMIGQKQQISLLKCNSPSKVYTNRHPFNHKGWQDFSTTMIKGKHPILAVFHTNK